MNYGYMQHYVNYNYFLSIAAGTQMRLNRLKRNAVMRTHL